MSNKLMTDVLITGAGPTGLVLALWLTRLGVKVRIIDKTDGPVTTSRAMAVQARTLELYRQLGLADTVVTAGNKNPGINVWVNGKHRARVPLGSAGAHLTPYSFMLVYPQDQHERLLTERLASMGVAVERQMELVDFEDKGDRIVARIQAPGRGEVICEARYIAGCDGARSMVRTRLGAGFEGGTYKRFFYVADVEASGLARSAEAHIGIESADFVAYMSYGNGRGRLIGIVRESDTQTAESFRFEDIGQRAVDSLGLKISRVNWFSTYRVHHRVTDKFQTGRALLVGDAAHVHSPAGGQGMNTGIGDSINLAWKLAAVVKGEASERLLESYDAERRVVARRLVDTTDRLFSFITSDGNFANFVRTRIAPRFISIAYSMNFVRELLFRMISQTKLSYRDSPLSVGVAGKVRGGDRLPWVTCDGLDNYASLAAIDWQVHVYGYSKPNLRSWCEETDIALHVYEWRAEYGAAGLLEDAAYLLRPDTYVAVAEQTASPAVLQQYLEHLGYRRPTHPNAS